MLAHKGKTLITTDGTTLLGADDKAGVAEIMNAVQYIMAHPEFKHGEIRIGFTPDEEIGRGVVKFDVKKFDADYAYTMDGGDLGELEFENFNAAAATIRIQGRNVHPGYAKGKMKNAMRIAIELNGLLPVEQKPEYTEGYEGFFHLIGFNGTVEEATISYIIRDHDMDLYEHKKAVMQECVDFINRKYGEGTAVATIRHQYYNSGDGGHQTEDTAYQGRYRRGQPFLHGPALPEYFRRRIELPWQDGIRTFGKHGSGFESDSEHHFSLCRIKGGRKTLFFFVFLIKRFAGLKKVRIFAARFERTASYLTILREITTR